METKIKLSEIVNLNLRQQLKRLAAAFTAANIGAVSDLESRLLTWINGDDIGSWILNSYRNYGIYYLDKILLDYNTDNHKWRLKFNLKSIFTDSVVLSDQQVIFNQQLGGESNPISSNGFEWLQYPAGVSKNYIRSYVSPDGSFPFPYLFFKEANQFNEIIIPEPGGGGVIPGGGSGSGSGQPGGSFQTTGQTKEDLITQVKTALESGGSASYLWIAAGALALYLIFKK